MAKCRCAENMVETLPGSIVVGSRVNVNSSTLLVEISSYGSTTLTQHLLIRSVTENISRTTFYSVLCIDYFTSSVFDICDCFKWHGVWFCEISCKQSLPFAFKIYSFGHTTVLLNSFETKFRASKNVICTSFTHLVSSAISCHNLSVRTVFWSVELHSSTILEKRCRPWHVFWKGLFNAELLKP